MSDSTIWSESACGNIYNYNKLTTNYVVEMFKELMMYQAYTKQERDSINTLSSAWHDSYYY